MRLFTRPDLANYSRTGTTTLWRQVAFGALCAGVMILLREIVNMWMPSSGPFSTIYPTILIATLYGRWTAGAVAFFITFFWAWYAVLPFNGSFAFEDPNEGPRVAINGICALTILIFAEIFRSAVARASDARDAEIDRREMAMLELGHRTKNNFALVASLLQIQKRREVNEEAAATLDTAIGRVQSFAEAYAYLQEDAADKTLEVAMRPYLNKLLDTLAPALFDGRVAVDRHIADIVMPKEKAVALGLVLNEALTNAAKYAFPSSRKGRVVVRLSADRADWEFNVDDDGVGRDEGAEPHGSGLGASLMETFARQAEAELKVESLEKGTRLRLRAAMA